jgi:site-specific recombinase XerD
MNNLKEYRDFIQEKSNDKSPCTISTYSFAIEKFLDYFKIENVSKVDSLTGNEYRHYRSVLLDSGLSNSSCNTHFRGISVFVNWLYSYEYIKNSPNIHKVAPLKIGKKVIFSLTPDECKAMVRSTNGTGKKLMLALMFETGIRRGEVVSIKQNDIFENKILIHGKGNKERRLSLTPEVVKLVNIYIKQLSKNKDKMGSEYLFPGLHGKKLSTESVRLRVEGAAKRAGIAPDRLAKITPHVTRKSLATNLLMNNTAIDVVQAILGHNSILTTKKYAETNRANIDRALLSQPSMLG